MKRGQDVFTTGQVAKICNVTIRTVIKWFENGKLDGYRIPASKDRRIPRKALLEFLKDHKIPYDPSLFDEHPKVLVVDDDEQVIETIEALLQQIDGLEVRTARSGYEAGFETARMRPDLLLIDYNLGDLMADQVLEMLAKEDRLEDVQVIVMSGYLDDDEMAELASRGLRVLKKPFDVEAFLAEIRAVLKV